jgi:uncharacterized protein
MAAALRVPIWVRPGSAATKVGGAHGDALVVHVTARAVGGRATEAALRAVAKALDVRRRDLRLVTGATSRIKLVEIVDPPPGILDLIDRLRDV